MDAAEKALIDQILAKLVLPGENPDKHRSVHTIGVGATGTFVASDIASQYCRAKHFDGRRHPATVRFSNGLGSAVAHDNWSDVRGMATRFHLSDKQPLDRRSTEEATDLIAMTLPEFFTATPEGFLAFLDEAKPVPVSTQSRWQKFLDQLRLMRPMPAPDPGETFWPVPGAIAWAGHDARSQIAVMNAAQMREIGPPASYARASYHAVHAFGIDSPEGLRRWVRFAWRPVSGVLNIPPDQRPAGSYLKDELRDRLTNIGPARFSLMMTIAEPGASTRRGPTSSKASERPRDDDVSDPSQGDDVTDPSRPWPPHRTRVVMGELTLDSMADDDLIEAMSFNPCLLADGMAPSDDPVLWARGEAYALSSQRRGGACPFFRS